MTIYRLVSFTREISERISTRRVPGKVRVTVLGYAAKIPLYAAASSLYDFIRKASINGGLRKNRISYIIMQTDETRRCDDPCITHSLKPFCV